jgi:hypothetical protein
MFKVMCPICWHEETFRALKQGTEPIRDDISMLLWHRPDGGVRTQNCTIWDGGCWRCEICDISLPPRMAAMMIDAVLRVSDPDSDSFNGETFEDAYKAAKGGSHNYVDLLINPKRRRKPGRL